MLKSKVKAYIEFSELSRDEIKKEMVISTNTLSAWSSGKSRPNLEQAFKLSRLLNCTVEDLWEYIED